MSRVAISRALGATCVVVAFGVSAAAQGEPMVEVAAMTGMVHGTAHDGHARMPHTMGASSVHDQHQSQTGDHAQHQKMMQRQGYARSAHDYPVPDLALLDIDGNTTSLAQALDTNKPVMLNFIYTTCTTICPILSATFSQVQRDLGDEADRVRMISISIDPDQDTPEKLREYAERFRAGPQWQFITGEQDQIVAVQKAFDIYRGAKTNHEPITLLRAPGATSWVRIEGIASAREIIREYHALASMTQ